MKCALTCATTFFLFLVILGPGTAPLALGQAITSISNLEAQQSLVNDYCVGCHNSAFSEAGFSWDDLDLGHPQLNADQAEQVIRKLRSGMMPPFGMPRPSNAELKGLATAIENRIDNAAATHSKAPELHRVNRREYRNSIRDLLNLDIDIDSLLPPDGRTGNFDNMADALTVTPALMQAYIRAADKIARQAIGDKQAPPVMAKFDIPKVLNQMRHVDGTPFGTRGGTSVTHNFPADGEYTFALELYYYYTGELIGSNLPESLQGQQIEISIDGERAGVFTVDPLIEQTAKDAIMVTDPIQVTAGPHNVAAAFIQTFDGPVEDHYRLVEQTLMDVSIALHAGMTALPHLQTLTITGPLKITGVSDTPSRKRVFTCYPSAPSEEEACAAKISAQLAAKAFRRPSTPEDLESLIEIYKVGRKEGDFETGIRTVLQAILAKPEFVFRFERVPKGLQAGQSYQISDLELASRLSYFLWSTSPDTELIDLAINNRLSEDGILAAQVSRMLADPRAETLSANFASQWLRLAGIEEIAPEPGTFPDFTRNLSRAMRREVELLFHSMVLEDRNILELLTADYTFVNETLARHYEIPDVVGNRFRRVKLDDPNRFGLIGKGGVLTLTSLANRTSPVARGKYVLEVLVGAPPPNPPAVVPPFKESVNNEKVLTVRERMEDHRQNPACNACHQIMDPIGLTLENFDATGRWRFNDGGFRIDPSSQMYDGTELNGVQSLSKAVLARSEAFLGYFAENLLAYGVGRVLDHRDMPSVRSIRRAAAENDNRFSTFVMSVVESAPFQMRTVNPETEEAAGSQH